MVLASFSVIITPAVRAEDVAAESVQLEVRYRVAVVEGR